MHEWIQYLARSDTRVSLLEALADGPRTRRELVDRLDVARTTLSRNLDRMAEFGWVEAGANGQTCRLTALGAHVHRAVDDLLADVGTGDDLEPFLSRVPADAFDLDPRLLGDADLVEATSERPLAPVERAMELRAGSTTLREFATVVMRESAAQVHERVREADPSATIEVVLDADVAATMREDPEYRDSLETMAGAEAIDYYVHGELPYLLALLDDRVLLGVVDERGTPLALVESGDDRVYDWAEDTFEAYREAASRLSV